MLIECGKRKSKWNRKFQVKKIEKMPLKLLIWHPNRTKLPIKFTWLYRILNEAETHNDFSHNDDLSEFWVSFQLQFEINFSTNQGKYQAQSQQPKILRNKTTTHNQCAPILHKSVPWFEWWTCWKLLGWKLLRYSRRPGGAFWETFAHCAPWVLICNIIQTKLTNKNNSKSLNDKQKHYATLSQQNIMPLLPPHNQKIKTPHRPKSQHVKTIKKRERKHKQHRTVRILLCINCSRNCVMWCGVVCVRRTVVVKKESV